MKDILVHVDGSAQGAARVRSAVELARAFRARLTGVHVTPEAEVRPGAAAGRVDALLELTQHRLAVNAREARKVFMASTAQEPDHGWISLHGDVVQCVSKAARYADLLIIGQYEQQGAAVRAIRCRSVTR